MDPVSNLELSNFAIMPSNCFFIMSLFYANVPVSKFQKSGKFHELARPTQNATKQSAGSSQIADEQPSCTARVVSWFKAAFHYDLNKPYNTNPKVTIGRMNNVCHCGANKWQGETPGMCCSSGKVKLDVLHAPPAILKKLLTEDTSDAKHFRLNLWKYNTAFAMTSFGADNDLINRFFFHNVQGTGPSLSPTGQPASSSRRDAQLSSSLLYQHQCARGQTPMLPQQWRQDSYDQPTSRHAPSITPICGMFQVCPRTDANTRP